MIVVDSNLIAYLLIPGDRSEEAENVLQRDSEWVVPLLWRSEFRNILTLYMRHSGMSLPLAEQTMTKAEKLFAGREYSVVSSEVLALTHERTLSAYDAEFVILAMHFGVPLVTLVKKLLKEVSYVAVLPSQFLKK
ncbi:type II toxin-antitoxin system VapC family toxin [Desulfobacterota bacterium AH_259_B03_O07]|nr:type II toxin-antitoxin system VapC family toxin [Desulfobacterota bacterium AH_259_B03_O07]